MSSSMRIKNNDLLCLPKGNGNINRRVLAVYTGATTTLASSPVPVVFPTKIEDTLGASVNLVTGEFVCEEPGSYRVTAFVSTAATVGVGRMSLLANQSGSRTLARVIGRFTKLSSASEPKAVSGTATFDCAIGDRLFISATDVDGNACATESFFEVQLVY
jgi:hypothetical protein